MGYTTDFLGHVDINPPLTDAEQEYLTAFRLSRRFDRPDGPYAVPGNPYVDERDFVDSDTYSRVAPGQPQLWCQWEACWDGCCLSWDGHEKFYRPVEWLRYLIDHFLRPDAEASRSGLSQFNDFRFDHRLDGLLIGNRRDNRELFAICVQDNAVTTRVLMPGDSAYGGRPPLPYEIVLDEWKEELLRITQTGRGLRPV
ncbi:MAG TPA: hypothetical protein VFM08_04485 [Nocardioides sp.]|jgi:hypothetical protein|nr:hypothetical protein [Nocardioides sp.]